MTSLVPREGGRYLNPMEVITRVQAEFAYVEASEEGARTQVLELMNQLAFVTAQGRAAADDKYLAQLEELQDAARFVHFGDDLGSDGMLLSMLMIPHQPLTIDAHAQDKETWVLINRCARALDYEVFEPQSVEVEAAAGSKYLVSYAAAA